MFLFYIINIPNTHTIAKLKNIKEKMQILSVRYYRGIVSISGVTPAFSALKRSFYNRPRRRQVD